MTAIATTEITRAPSRDGLWALMQQIRAHYARRVQRTAIAALLEMDADRLDDLGLSASDVRIALAGPGSTGSHLHKSRANRALGWAPARR